ncbi:MAG: hypothetical protein PGN16_18215 [Sphingomonas phyllosphaerae]|uniref:hypothetical protein n=1 Tax=Sphingomonas phyllosphaerae TaxID=257003 RepID=UPI002FF79C61
MKVLAIAVLLSSGVAEARFAPVLDAPYRLVRTQEHHSNLDGGRRFESERHIVFMRGGAGYLARITLVGTSDSHADSKYAMLATAMGDRPVEVELDRRGHLLKVRDLDAIWARLRAAIGAAATRDDVRLTLWRVHDAATTAQRVQVVAGVLSTILAPEEAERSAGTRAVTLPSVGAVPLAAPMRGTETVRRDGRLIGVTVQAKADDGSTAVVLSRRRTIDRTSGLVTEQREEQTIGSRIGGEGHLDRDITTIRLSPPVL